MGRECSQCYNWCDRWEFSGNQWSKGDGRSRCKSCVEDSYGCQYECHECYRVFQSQNQLNMHMQVHRPRNISCPICGETRFRSGANAVQHVESGYCSGCPGRENARNQIYQYASSQSAMRPYMTDVPMLTNGNYRVGQGPGDFPYQCPHCSKSFRQLSQLLQHKDQKHNSYNLLSF